jgi:hypothetical protein
MLGMSRVVVTMVTTPRLGEVTIDDGERWPEMLGFQFGEK